MNRYKAKLQHDNGKHIITVRAESESKAKELVLKAEGCPPSAIIGIKLVKE